MESGSRLRGLLRLFPRLSHSLSFPTLPHSLSLSVPYSLSHSLLVSLSPTLCAIVSLSHALSCQLDSKEFSLHMS